MVIGDHDARFSKTHVQGKLPSVQWNRHAQCCPNPGTGRKSQVSVQDSQTFAHADQPETGMRGVLDVEPEAVISNAKVNKFLTLPQSYGQLRGSAMAHDVLESFLGNPIQAQR